MPRLLQTQKLGRVLQAHKSEYLKIPSGIIINCSTTNWSGTYDFDFQPGESLTNWDQDIHYANQIIISSSGDKILMLLIERSGMNDAIAFLFKDIHGYYEEINQELAFSSLRNHFYTNLDAPLRKYFGVAQEEVSMIMVSRFEIQGISIQGNPLDYKTIQTELVANELKRIMCAVLFTDNDAGRDAAAAAAETAPIEAAAREEAIREEAAREAAAASVGRRSSVSSARGKKRGHVPLPADDPDLEVYHTIYGKPPAPDPDPDLDAYRAAYADVYAPSSAAASKGNKKSRTSSGGKRRKGKMTKRKITKKRNDEKKRKTIKKII